jgi:hypothetical protein
VLQECACGEPLLDDVRKCPRCGKPNPSYRPSRWRTFWPEVDSLAGSDEAITLGYWAAFFVAVLGAVMALLPGVGPGIAGLADAIVYALCGLGVWRKWRIAALLAFLLFVANVIFSISRGGGVGVLSIFIFAGLINGVRGTFAWAKLSRSLRSETAG